MNDINNGFRRANATCGDQRKGALSFLSARAGAIESIRLVDDEQVDTIIAHYLDYNYEAEALVRKAAIRTAKVRDSIIVNDAVLKVSKSDPDKRVQKAAAQILKNYK